MLVFVQAFFESLEDKTVKSLMSFICEHKSQFILLMALLGAAKANQLWSREKLEAYCDLLCMYIEDVRRVMQATAKEPRFYVSAQLQLKSLNSNLLTRWRSPIVCALFSSGD